MFQFQQSNLRPKRHAIEISCFTLPLKCPHSLILVLFPPKKNKIVDISLLFSFNSCSKRKIIRIKHSSNLIQILLQAHVRHLCNFTAHVRMRKKNSQGCPKRAPRTWPFRLHRVRNLWLCAILAVFRAAILGRSEKSLKISGQNEDLKPEIKTAKIILFELTRLLSCN